MFFLARIELSAFYFCLSVKTRLFSKESERSCFFMDNPIKTDLMQDAGLVFTEKNYIRYKQFVYFCALKIVYKSGRFVLK